MTPAQIAQAAAELVARTCEEQHLPVVVTDPVALSHVAAILRGAVVDRERACS